MLLLSRRELRMRLSVCGVITRLCYLPLSGLPRRYPKSGHKNWIWWAISEAHSSPAVGPTRHSWTAPAPEPVPRSSWLGGGRLQEWVFIYFLFLIFLIKCCFFFFNITYLVYVFICILFVLFITFFEWVLPVWYFLCIVAYIECLIDCTRILCQSLCYMLITTQTAISRAQELPCKKTFFFLMQI